MKTTCIFKTFLKRLLKNVLETIVLEIGQRAVSASLFRDCYFRVSFQRHRNKKNKERVNQLEHRESFHQRPMGQCLAKHAWGIASVDENVAPCSLILFRHASVRSLKRNQKKLVSTCVLEERQSRAANQNPGFSTKVFKPITVLRCSFSG